MVVGSGRSSPVRGEMGRVHDKMVGVGRFLPSDGQTFPNPVREGLPTIR